MYWLSALTLTLLVILALVAATFVGSWTAYVILVLSYPLGMLSIYLDWKRMGKR